MSEPMPAMTEGEPAPGKFVRQVAPEYKDTNVYHVLYLPVDWKAGQRYPVIVEYSGNSYGAICSGKPEGCKLGYYQSAGRGFLWVVMPFIETDLKQNALTWWGSVPATLAYCKTNLERICEQYGGDPNALFLTGFSRGAIACGYLGLQDDEIADLWLGFLPHSHHDGGSYTEEGSQERLARIKGRASFITYGSNDNGKANSLKGASLLEKLKFPAKTVEIPKLEHTDQWITHPSTERDAMRAWMADLLASRTGTHAISGRVTDPSGKGLPAVRVRSGWHWVFTNEKGEFKLPGLVSGERTLVATKEGCQFPAQQKVNLLQSDVTGVLIKPKE